MDWRLLEEWLDRVPVVITVEDHALHGGFGSAILEAAADHQLDCNRIRRLGIPDRFIEHGGRGELMKMLGLDARGIAESARKICQSGVTGKVAM